MGKVKGKHRLDKFYYLAKEHGYRSRAAWKLVQLDTKFNFLRSARSVLDLCAAPGGWMQVAVERAPVGSLVVGVDLDPIRPIRGAFSLQEDITGPKCRSGVKRIMAENGCGAFELVLHDGSPNVGGAWTKEATSQNALVIDSLKLATELLAPKGTFITKVFRSQDYTAVLYCLRQLFEKVEVDKPLASRSASAEIYIVGLKYKAPAKIDPRLLDVKHLFQGGQEPPKIVDVLRTSKQKRHRDGYEDGVSILKKTCSASEFLWSDSPLDILGSVTSISFGDSASLPVKDHILTTEEVKALCDDLRVLGKQDFKHLLKWRMQLRKALAPAEKAAPASEIVEPVKEVDEEEKVLNEMEELTYAMEQKKKRAKKALLKKRAKDKARKALGTHMDAVEDGYGDQDLFSLTSMKGKKDLAAVDSNEYDDVDSGNSESDENHDENGDTSDIDSEEERRRYDEKVEKLLDDAYEHMVSKREGSSRQRKRSKEAYSNNDDLAEDDGDALAHYDDSDDELPNQESNPLMVALTETEPTQEEIAAQWFNQDVFMDEDEHVELDQDESEDEMQVDPPLKHSRAAEKVKEKVPEKLVGKQNGKMQSSKSAKVDEEIEIVPAPDTDSSDSSDDESDDDDINTKAEILACAKKMLTKKQREDMIDDAYNKYMFHDDGLPKWFVDEEKKHYQPIKPVTKEEVAAMRAHFKAINARPAKKVAEAKARKKRDAHRQLEKIRKKANAVSDQADISERSKNKMIDQLYRKVGPKRTEREYVVAKKGVQVKTGKGKVLVDRRMKKDSRTHGMNKQGKGKGRGKQKGKGGMRSAGKGKGKGRESRKAK